MCPNEIFNFPMQHETHLLEGKVIPKFGGLYGRKSFMYSPWTIIQKYKRFDFNSFHEEIWKKTYKNWHLENNK